MEAIWLSIQVTSPFDVYSFGFTRARMLSQLFTSFLYIKLYNNLMVQLTLLHGNIPAPLLIIIIVRIVVL